MSAAAQGWLGPTLLAATAVLGWLYGDWRKRVEERRLRNGKVLDIQKALRAEIEAHLHQLRRWEIDGRAAETVAQILAAGDAPGSRFVPLLPPERHDRVYGAMVGEVHLLSTETVRPVVLYYNQIALIADMSEMLRAEAYAEVSAPRRAEAYAHYIRMKRTAVSFGDAAAEALDADIQRREPSRYVFSS